MRYLRLAVLGCCFLFNVAAYSQSLPYEITDKQLQAHVTFLCSDALAGRLTGSEGEKLATQYVADRFQQLGLEPAGDHGTYFQTFPVMTGASLGKDNVLLLKDSAGKTKKILLNQDWQPLAFSASASFQNTELVFVGFGISVPAYDSYRNINVKNKWVLVLRYAPLKYEKQFSPYVSLRYKMFVAKQHGAKGIIFVDPMQAKNQLLPFTFDSSFPDAGIVALSMKREVLNDLLKEEGSSLKALQASLDSGSLPDGPDMQGINVSGSVDIERKNGVGRNVLAKLKSTTPQAPLIVVGAHVDHLGYGISGASRAHDNEAGMVHPGADDNASGVASLLEVAAQLSSLQSHNKLHAKKDILFAAWSGEELGVLGSTHFVKDFKQTHALHPSIDAMLNLDMIGRLRKNLVLQGVGSSPDWLKVITNQSFHLTFKIITEVDPYLPTDSTPFYLQGVPTLNFFTGAHDEYHTPRDTPDTLNYSGMKKISNFLAAMIQALAEDPKAMPYQAVPITHDKTQRETSIYLGTIPDYASTKKLGVKLSGVAANSPASRAGLQGADIIMELAGKPVHDIYDYTFVLNALPVGRATTLRIERGHTTKTLTIVPQYRE